MGWSSGDKSNVVGWAGSGGKVDGNSHGWVDENQGSNSSGAAGQAVMTAAELAAEAAKAEGNELRKYFYNSAYSFSKYGNRSC